MLLQVAQGGAAILIYKNLTTNPTGRTNLLCQNYETYQYFAVLYKVSFLFPVGFNTPPLCGG
jgi:hypothetical protein